MKSAFNKKYIASSNNLDLEYPLFKETTILKIESGKIIESYVGDDITTLFNILINEE